MVQSQPNLLAVASLGNDVVRGRVDGDGQAVAVLIVQGRARNNAGAEREHLLRGDAVLNGAGLGEDLLDRVLEERDARRTTSKNDLSCESG